MLSGRWSGLPFHVLKERQRFRITSQNGVRMALKSAQEKSTRHIWSSKNTFECDSYLHTFFFTIGDFPIQFSMYTSCRIHHVFWACEASERANQCDTSQGFPKIILFEVHDQSFGPSVVLSWAWIHRLFRYVICLKFCFFKGVWNLSFFWKFESHNWKAHQELSCFLDLYLEFDLSVRYLLERKNSFIVNCNQHVDRAK